MAEAGVRPGLFAGKTQQNAKVGFQVVKKGVVEFELEGGVLRCSDGQRRQLEGFITSRRNLIPLDGAGRFGFRVGPDDDSVGARISGQVKATRATGSARMFAKVNRDDEIDPQGAIRCDTDPLRWNARRR